MIPGFTVTAEDGSIGRFDVYVDEHDDEKKPRFQVLQRRGGVAGSRSSVDGVMDCIARLWPALALQEKTEGGAS